MALFKKKKPVAPEEIDLESIDRESKYKIFSEKGDKIIKVVLTLWALFQLYASISNKVPLQILRYAHLGLAITMAYILYPATQKSNRNKLPWYDCVLAGTFACVAGYFILNYSALQFRAGAYTMLDTIMAGLGIALVLLACWRVVGPPIVIIASCFFVYGMVGNYLPGFLQHRGFSLKRIITHLFITTEGVIGNPLGVCSTYIFLFILFGAFLEKTGIGQFFIDLANALAGWAAGGPAKVAVISSALCGMVSGSSVGNTVTTGSVTIPMMKKTGYKGEFAGAVEAAASTGGQIMPPIMGAAAFLMVDYVSLPYSNIVVRAILPAVLYFTGIFICVHLEAKKSGLQGVPRRELPPVMPLLKKTYLLLPLVILVYLVSSGSRTMAFAAAVATVAAIVVSMFSKETRMTPKKFFEALAGGTQGCISVGVACCVAGIVAGCLTMTGLANQILHAIIGVSGNAKLLALFLTMLCCIVLGMGVPTTANYCIMATTCAPILVQMGIPTVAAHFFVFYFGIVADLTPPVALAAYAGAAIAGANPMKTAFNATKLAIAAFIIPYILAYNPAMVLVDTTVTEVVMIAITSLIGMFGLGMALEGYYRGSIPWYLRILSAAGGLCLVDPGTVTDVIGIVVVGAIVVMQILRAKKTLKAA